MKITLLQRLFWTSEKIEAYILSGQQEGRNLETIEGLYKQQIKTIQTNIDDKDTTINRLTTNLDELKLKVRELETSIEHKEGDLEVKQSSLSKLKVDIGELRAKLEAKASENSNLRTEISERLLPLDTINKTFFAKTGNKGKGEFGEMQVKTILEKSGLDVNFWVENLMVGKNIVEFAIRSGESDKWIPVDSKVLDPEIDEENGLAIIDATYKSRVNTQVREVAKYLGKKETANYGLLVLQSDSIYMKLFEEFPTFFQDTIRDHKIHIMSPSSFVQFAWTISQILDIYERVHLDGKIYDEMVDALNTASNFANALTKTHKDFNSAMNRWYPSLEKKHAVLNKKLEKQGKIKPMNQLEVKDVE